MVRKIEQKPRPVLAHERILSHTQPRLPGQLLLWRPLSPPPKTRKTLPWHQTHRKKIARCSLSGRTSCCWSRLGQEGRGLEERRRLLQRNNGLVFAVRMSSSSSCFGACLLCFLACLLGIGLDLGLCGVVWFAGYVLGLGVAQDGVACWVWAWTVVVWSDGVVWCEVLPKQDQKEK